jgi:hypothetical protein
MRDLTEEQRRRLHLAYTYILSLRKKTTPASETLPGAGAGVAEDTDEWQSPSHFSRDCPTMQESED